jgi:hypothetical protein
MKRLMLAAIIAVPFVAFSQQKAKAGNECLDLPRWLRYRLCTCLHEKCGTGNGHLGGHGGCLNGGCGQGGCGYGGCANGGCLNGGCGRAGGCCACNLFGCDSRVQGPWYLYWPYNGQTQEIAGYGPAWPGGWNYEMHFQTASPWGMPMGPNGFGAAVAFPGAGPGPMTSPASFGFANAIGE